MRNFIFKLAVIAGLAMTTAGFAQQQPKAFGRTIAAAKINPNNGLVRCASTEYEQHLLEKYPNRQTTEEFEEWLAPKIQEAATRRMSSPVDVATVITIPVVVHVIHNETSVGVNENIADAQVLSQITVLNQDYRRMLDTPGYNTHPAGADMEIQFVLAKVDPQGNPTNGIDRVYFNRSSWNETQVETIMKPQTSWNPSKYFNIWVCRFGGDLSDVLGYAQFPSQSGLGGLSSNEGPADTDGVIIDYRYFGSIEIYPQGTYGQTYNQGRTATHEIGHCFGLRHVDGDNTSCSVNATDSYQDYCPDTPAVKYLNYGCSYSDSCPSAAGPDMIENYMDYTDDACMSIFTQNQKNRLMAVLQNSPRRASLTTSDVWQPLAAQSFSLPGMSVYPNPANDVLNIASGNNITPDSYIIYNSLGQQVTSAKLTGNTSSVINISSLTNGVYFIKLEKGDKASTLKFVKN